MMPYAAPRTRGRPIYVAGLAPKGRGGPPTRSPIIYKGRVQTRPLGYADSDHKVVFYRSPARKHTYQTVFDVSNTDQLPRVDLAYAYAGGDGVMIRAAIQAGAQGIVSAGSGAGGGSPDYNKALVEALANGINVVQASQVGSGRVVTTAQRQEQGFLVSDDLSPKKARILLMLGLAVTKDRGQLQEMFYTY